MDGRTLVDGVEEYSLFKEVENEEVAKTSEEDKDTIKSFDINELVEFTDKYHISDISNLIISGDLKETKTVDWSLKNIIFEKDMSNLINEASIDSVDNPTLEGIVYFKNLPYNNKKGQYLTGTVKLKELNGLKDFKIRGDNPKSVVDLREINEDKMTKYNPSYEDHIFEGIGGVYFDKEVRNLKKDDKFYIKFINGQRSEYINNVYFGDNREYGFLSNVSDNIITTSKTARTLSEFEFFGNNGYYEKSAKDSYKENLEKDNFDGLDLLDIQIERLKQSANDKTIAKVTAARSLC